MFKLNYYVLNKNREWRKEWERWVGGDGVVVHWVNHLDDKKPFRPLYILKHLLKNDFMVFIYWSNY